MASPNKPTRPQKIPLDKAPKVEAPVVTGDDIAKPTSFDTNKYSPKNKIGKPTLGPKRVERVGLGGLTTETHYGIQPDV